MAGLNDTTWLDQVLERISAARVAVFGDFCLDAYWLIDADEGEVSIETGLPVRRVRQQRYGLGGAGNVVANLAALGVAKVHAVGLVGDDLFGQKLLQLLRELGADVSGMVSDQEDWQTLVYAKPCIGERELNRIDFGGFGVPSSESMEKLAAQLERVAGEVDIVILNQQVSAGVSTPEMIAKVNEVIARDSRQRGLGLGRRCRFIVDARQRAALYRGAVLKLNAHEAARLLGEARPLDERIGVQAARSMAQRLTQRTGKAVFVTRGERGIIAAKGSCIVEVPGIQIIEQTDPVGAGDTTVAALAAVAGSRGDIETAAKLANMAASITVRKLQTTGTATPEEIRALGPEPGYVYLPELADDPRQARFVEGADIEIVRELPSGLKIRHAVFDHDGTLCTLREGWERVMEPMMVRAILGNRYEAAEEKLYQKVVETVRGVIERTTGIQTLAQMQVLAGLVKQFGCVPADEILDMHGYKRAYCNSLMESVHQRLGRLRSGELGPADFEIKGATALLQRLRRAGVKLYLASGTDETDVRAEAQAMGYADLFEGRIYGGVGDLRVEAKREVLDRIIREHGLNTPARALQLVMFGDGPVEMRLTQQRGGIAVGVASDEVRRFGGNPAKRSRLIRGGADLIIPDYSQPEKLLHLLGIGCA